MKTSIVGIWHRRQVGNKTAKGAVENRAPTELKFQPADCYRTMFVSSSSTLSVTVMVRALAEKPR